MNVPGLLRGAAAALVIGLGARAALGARSVPTEMIQAPVVTEAQENKAPAMDHASPDAIPSELQIMVAEASLADGDAPGTDSTWTARPAESTRLLDAPLAKNGARIRVYSTTRDLADVMSEVDHGLRNNGFSRKDSSADPRTSTYSQGSRHVVARFSLSTEEERVLVSLMEVELRTAED